MAHSYDRTLLANLGFADPDKGDPLHDLACQYVGQESVCNAMGLTSAEGEALIFDGNYRAAFEQPVSKGQGKYKTTIGFVDVVLPFKNMSDETEFVGYPEGYRKTGKREWNLSSVFVEVKIKSLGLGDILRQINLYREYLDNYRWLLVAAFEMSAAMEEGLLAHDVTPLRLGDGFRAFVEQQKAVKRTGGARAI